MPRTQLWQAVRAIPRSPIAVPAWGRQLTKDDDAAMERLFQALLAGRPRGWSVVRGTGAIVVRPADRALGKVSVSPSIAGQVYVSFFSRRRNHWAASDHFSLGEAAAPGILAWAFHATLQERAQHPE